MPLFYINLSQNIFVFCCRTLWCLFGVFLQKLERFIVNTKSVTWDFSWICTQISISTCYISKFRFKTC